MGRKLQFAIPFLLAAGYLVLTPKPVLAADIFPRGPGFYFSIPKLVTLLIVYFCWVRTCWWVNHDATELKLPATLWNQLLVGCGLLGLLGVWLLPWYWLVSLPLLAAFYLTPSLVYVNVRNGRVASEHQVLTERHFKELARKYLRLNLGEDEEEQDLGPPIEFINKSQNVTEDTASRVARISASKGVRAAKEIVWEALERRATDIHLEPTKEEMTVRLRIDGILHATDPFSRSMGDAVLNIFKVLAGLDITEKRKPQDGSLSAQLDGRTIDMRVATAGSVVGEKMVMRILDKSQQIIDLTRIGLRDRLREKIHALAAQPHGMLIVCGPTGAGKSTTLYACLNEIDRFQKNVITIENPVEYQIDNVTQIEVNPKAGKTFASELRSILRQDPDVIYIGEIRDDETAEIACQAAQTGHMVFTTLHANDTATALGRLLDLGVQPFMVGSSVSAVLGQRLVRVLCPRCKQRYKPNPDMLRKANLPADRIKFFFRPPQGNGEGDSLGNCEHCGGTGYHGRTGRTGVFEMLVISESIRELIRDNPDL